MSDGMEIVKGIVVHLWRHYLCWMINAGFEVTHASIQMGCISAYLCAYLSKTRANHILHILQQRWVLNRPACNPDLTPTKNIWNTRKKLSKNKNTAKEACSCWAAETCHQETKEKHFVFKIKSIWFLWFLLTDYRKDVMRQL